MKQILLVAGCALISVSARLDAEVLTLWQDDGNGKDLTGAHVSRYNGFHSASSSGTVVTDPTATTHGGVHRMVMNGTNGTSTEWGALLVDGSPYNTEGVAVWDNRIVPGQTKYTFTAEFYIPDDTTMTGSDRVYLLLRFYAANSTFNDGELISVLSTHYDYDDRGSWVTAKLEGTIPAVDQAGNPIVRVEPRVPVSDYLTNAGTGVFAYVDNIKFTVDIPPMADLPVHQVITNPSQSDRDSNGLADLWEALYNAQGLVPNSDNDQDGRTNQQESEAGTNPFDATSRLDAKLIQDGGNLKMRWPDIPNRPNLLETSTDMGVSDPWTGISYSSSMVGSEHEVDLSDQDPKRFYRVKSTEPDSDNDQVPDWVESYFGFKFGAGGESSTGNSRSYDTTGDGNPDVTLSGDLARFNEIYLPPDNNTRMTEAQAARFLIQATFGPTYEDIKYVQRIGPAAWIAEQMSLPKTTPLTYSQAIKDDFDNGDNDPELAGYVAPDFVRGLNFMNGWARATVSGQDQLRQRVAFALSQIVVASRNATGLANQGYSTSHYYNQFIDEAFGNYEDLLNKVSRHPLMGHYLSSLGNQKADVSIERYPDENYARELMQLFTIGLWELNLDGTRKLDLQGEPIPTYGNPEITELARVFTGIHYASSNFGGGYKDDGFYMTTPMKVFPDEHDFGAKTLVTGHVIPARSATEANGVQDIEDAIYHLVRHPNTGPFVCRQLIQFLVTANPTPAYVARVAAVFQNNGSGVVGDMNAVVQAILLDEEARNPGEHLGTPYFGHLREPVIRTMHLARVMNLSRYPNLMWWDWGQYRAESLQEPMASPSVFNFYRPDFRMRGSLAQNQLDSPVFGITDSYAAIAFPNRLWKITEQGFKFSDYDFPPDWSALTPLANDIPALLDRVNLLFCAGTMSARSREIITTVLQSTSDTTERIELAVYLAMICPEGACIK
ncbi:MAG: DUF1800 domain-containing protein [Verrucomicrobiota bacterium]